MDPYLNEWLSILLRWLHIIAAVAWIGASFYFVYLDLSLRPPKRREDAEAGVGGEFWAVHGGGFYHTQKYRLAPGALPEPLHWFKWEAYTTWLSGFSLFVVLYYVNADEFLVDPQVADISTGVAILASIGLLALAWVVYDLLCRLLAGRELALGAGVVVLTVAAAYVSTQLFSPRAAFLQVGAMLGTIMAGNVFFNIIPAHRKLVAAKEAGREPDPRPALRAKERSVHNNYLTLPVVFAMISIHFPIAYSAERSWLVLVVLMAAGAWIRYFFNLRHQGRTHYELLVMAGAVILAVALVLRPEDDAAGTTDAEPVAFAQVEAIVQERCAVCHSSEPTEVPSAPAGITFDTPEQIAARADAIQRQAVDARAMPPGNVTGMTDEERDVLAAWIAQGAQISP